MPDVHVPTVLSDGMVATHDQACAVCWKEKAVYDCNRAIFHPCWKCQKNGWSLRYKRWTLRPRSDDKAGEDA